MKVELLIRQKSIDKLTELDQMSKGHLGKIENGKTNPTISTLLKIAEALGAEIKELYKIYY